MSEFKITHKTTLYELQEYCKENSCDTCELCEGYDMCRYNGFSPDDWNVPKLKTYKDDFLEKFPNAKNECGIPIACKRTVYGGEACYVSQCSECWNEIMEE